MIYVLGVGNIGSLLAVALAREHAVRLLLRPSTYHKFIETGQSTIRLRSGSAEWEQIFPSVPTNKVDRSIQKLVVAVKAYDVAPALANIRDYLTPKSELLIMHNGMGVEEHVRTLWPRETDMPQLSFGVTNAGVKRLEPQWTFEYSGNGINTVTGETVLVNELEACRGVVLTDVVEKQVFSAEQKRKLVVNSVINGLASLLQCPNGGLPGLDAGLMRRITHESSRILHLDGDTMFELVMDVVHRTRNNISSMLADIERGRPTEIEYINGYIVREARRQNTSAPLNLMLRDLVDMRLKQVRHELESVIPLDL